MDSTSWISWFKRRGWRVAGWAVALLCMFAPTLALAATLTGTFKGTGIGRVVAFTHDGKQRNDWAGVLRLQLDNGPEVPVFCVQLNVRVRSGDRYRSDGPVLALPNGCRIRYLLDAYPASTATDADEAAARQLAIWVFSDNLDPTTIQDAKVRDRTIALVTEAQGKPCPTDSTQAPDLAIDPPTANGAPGQVVSYMISAGASHAGQTVTVSVDGPAVLSDANGTNSGQQQQQVALDGQGNAAIWVLSTGAGQSAVSATLPYQLDAGTVFSHIDNNRPTQRLVMAERQSLSAKATAQATWAGAAPPPVAPTPPAQPSATLIATAPPAQATATAEATAPPAQATASPVSTPASAPATTVPTRRPSRSRSTPKPTAEQPTAVSEQAATATTVPSSAGASATPAPASNATPSPIAQAPAEQTGGQQSSGPAAGGQGGNANQSPATGNAQTPAGAANQAVSGAGASRPAGLPRTGAPASPGLGMLIAGLVALLGGWGLRRRALRER